MRGQVLKEVVRVVTLVCGSAALAQPEAVASRAWRELTHVDLEAARVLIADNHPAAVAELGDEAFRARFEAAHAEARQRADQVTSYSGYAATLQSFAYGLGDKHLWARPCLSCVEYTWAGLVAARRGPHWVVTHQSAQQGEPALEGARLLACDGRAVDEVAAERLGRFRAVWSIEAQRIAASPWLLIDDGNPFLRRPAVCEFERDGQVSSVLLRWREVARQTLAPLLGAAVPAGRAGYGVRPFAAGWWIGVERLSADAQPVIEAVKQHLEALRAAPVVVVDVRGNGGGNSQYGLELAEALLGEKRVEAVVTDTGASECPTLWRASAGNLAALQRFRQASAASMNEDTAAYYEALEKELSAALAAGRPFDEPLAPCEAKKARRASKRRLPKSLLKGRLVLVTDHECFSSCLLMTEQLRRLGALHVGQATDAATRYMEVREELLPSGLSYFSTLQKVVLGAPRQIGPFVPEHLFDGDISDTAALEAWVAALVGR